MTLEDRIHQKNKIQDKTYSQGSIHSRKCNEIFAVIWGG